MYSNLQNSIGYESLSGRSVSQSTCNLTTSKSSDIIQSLCRELDMPSSFVDHALHDLLGVERKGPSKATGTQKPPPTKMMVSFLSRAFKRCTQDARLVVIALDDLHNADEFSWMVIQDIFETAQNVLIIGATYPQESYQLKVQPEFMRALTEKHAANKRFVSMDLHSLNREEITSMIMKTLGLQRKEVKDDVLEGITIQSGGMPHFVNEILGFIKRQIAVNADFEMSDVSCRKHAFVESFVFSDTQCSVDFFR